MLSIYETEDHRFESCQARQEPSAPNLKFQTSNTKGSFSKRTRGGATYLHGWSGNPV